LPAGTGDDFGGVNLAVRFYPPPPATPPPTARPVYNLCLVSRGMPRAASSATAASKNHTARIVGLLPKEGYLLGTYWKSDPQMSVLRRGTREAQRSQPDEKKTNVSTRSLSN
jgi:hypothetical protein